MAKAIFLKKKLKRNLLYKNLLTLLYTAHAGHIGSSLSCLDILSVLFFFVIKKEDTFILSKGHAVPALYSVLNALGRISDDALQTFHANGTRFPAHPPAHLDEFVPFPSGSLGHGLSLSCGMAQANYFLEGKSKKRMPKVYCLVSDGECNEGQVWEAAQYASAKKIGNLVVLVDNNKLQAFGKTADVLGKSTTPEKWKAFGWEVYSANGHSPKEIVRVFEKVDKSHTSKPKVIIFDTIKGYGVSFMQNQIGWHYHTLTENLYQKALISVDKKIQ